MDEAKHSRRPAVVLSTLALLLAGAATACHGSGPCRPSYGSFGASGWPPACWTPYATDSVFDTPIPQDAVPSRNSDAIVRFILQHARNKYPSKITVHADGTQDGEPTYWVRSDDADTPEFTIHCTQYACPGVEGVAVPIPAGAVTENGSDHHLTVVDQSSDTEYDLWQVDQSKVPIPHTGGQLDVSSAASLPITSGRGHETAGNATASFFGSLAGRVRAEEVSASTPTAIRHALFIDIDCHDGHFVLPATYAPAGGTCTSTPADTLAPPLGTWLQLGMSDSEIAQLPRWEQPYAHAMATYGMYFGDTGADGYVGIESETGTQYTSRGAPDPWRQWAEDNASQQQPGWSWYAPDSDWVGTWTGIDWTRLRVLCQPEDTSCPH